MKVCLVADQISGAGENEPIGIVTSRLAFLLAANGHAVTLFHAAALPDPLGEWELRYREANIRVLHFPPTGARIYSTFLHRPCEIFEQLRYREFDAIVFQDWLALGHSCTVAKKCGLAFANTVLATIAHINTLWTYEANRSFPNSLEPLTVGYLERRAIEESDALVSPSHYMAGWMRRAGWKLPENTAVIPFYAPAGNSHSRRESIARPVAAGATEHIVFIGNPDEGNGIGIFLKALASESLPPRRFQLTFLGGAATGSVDAVRDSVARLPNSPIESFDFKSHYSPSQARDFLLSRDCVAVMPALVDHALATTYELLALGIPFIAADTGCMPELIDETDRARILFQPNPKALAAKLREVLDAPVWPPSRPRYDSNSVGDLWLAWFERLGSAASRPARAASCASAPPKVTVAVTHHERPALLEHNLNALALQTDSDFDLIVVDDGSQSTSAIEFLASIERRYSSMNPRVVRQPNLSPGAARNTAVRNADNRYIIFLDDDNVPFPNLVEVFKSAIHHSGADVVTCQMQFFRDPTGAPDLNDLLVTERWGFPGGPPAVGAIQNCFGDTTAIYKRELFETIGNYREALGVTFEDWALHFRWAMAGAKLLSLPMPLFWYRVTPGSLSLSTSLYENLQLVADSVRQNLNPKLAPLLDLLIGSHSNLHRFD